MARCYKKDLREKSLSYVVFVVVAYFYAYLFREETSSSGKCRSTFSSNRFGCFEGNFFRPIVHRENYEKSFLYTINTLKAVLCVYNKVIRKNHEVTMICFVIIFINYMYFPSPLFRLSLSSIFLCYGLLKGTLINTKQSLWVSCEAKVKLFRLSYHYLWCFVSCHYFS